MMIRFMKIDLYFFLSIRPYGLIFFIYNYIFCFIHKKLKLKVIENNEKIHYFTVLYTIINLQSDDFEL